MTFLFWNLGRQPVAGLIEELVRREEVEVIALAEAPQDEAPQDKAAWLIPWINRLRPFRPVSLESSLQMFVASPLRVEPRIETNRYSISRLKTPSGFSMTLAIAHLPRKLYDDESGSAYHARNFASDVRRVEEEAAHRRTLIMGDLNANPFESALVEPDALNAVMTRAQAAKGARTVGGREYGYFYNPMWSLLGDLSPGPPGTWYKTLGKPKEYFWNCLDHCLLGPDLLSRFTGSIAILDRVGDTVLSDERGVRSGEHPDHLPLILRLNLE